VTRILKHEAAPTGERFWIQAVDVASAETAAVTEQSERMVEVCGDLGRVVRDLVRQGDYLVFWGGQEILNSECHPKRKFTVLNAEDGRESSFVVIYRHNVSGFFIQIDHDCMQDA